MLSKVKIEEIAARAKQEFDSSRFYYSSIQTQQERSLAYYNQFPYGSELTTSESNSSFITSDVRDTVDFYLAQLMDMFGKPGTAKFNAVPHEDQEKSKQDVVQAEIETAYCDSVIFDQNDGFLNIYIWIKDALIQKNGVIKVYWDESVEEKNETYDQITYIEYGKLLNDDEFNVKSVKVGLEIPKSLGLVIKELEGEFDPVEFGVKLEELGITDPSIMKFTEFKVKGVRVKDVKKVHIRNVAPENIVISSQWDSPILEKCPYIGERIYLTRADLINQGYDFNTVMSLPKTEITADTSGVAIRYQLDQQKLIDNQNITEAGEMVEIIEHYFIEFENQQPKMYCLITGNYGQHILDCYEVDGHGYISTTQKAEPYNYYGSSVADEVVDLQFTKSKIRRAAIDNLVLSSVPRTKSRGDIDEEALFDVRSGVNIRLESPDADVVPMDIPFVAGSAVQFEEVLNNDRAERTGYSREASGLDAAALSNATNFVGAAILDQAKLKVKLAASCMASVGFKQLYLKIRELLYKHEDRKRVFNMQGKTMVVNPREWVDGRGCSVSVGLGYAGKQEKTMVLQNVIETQKEILKEGGLFNNPLVNVMNVYDALKDYAQASGVHNFSSYFSNPEGFQPQQPAPTPADIQAQGYVKDVENRKEVEFAKIKSEDARKEAELSKEYEFKYRELANEYAYKYDVLINETQNSLEQLQNRKRERVESIGGAIKGQQVIE